MAPTSITVVGGGIVGCCTAYYLASHESRPAVTLIEGTEIAAGASGKAAGLVARDMHGPATASLGRLSYKLHQDLATEHDGEKEWGYRRVTTWSVVVGNGKFIQRNSTADDDDGFPIDWFHQNVNHSSIISDNSATAQVHPKLFTRKILEIAQTKYGVKVIDNVHVNGVSVKDDDDKKKKSYSVSLDDTDNRVIESDHVVFAAGPWTGPLLTKILNNSIASSKTSSSPSTRSASNDKGSSLAFLRKTSGSSGGQQAFRINGCRAHSVVVKPTNDFLSPDILFLELDSGTPELYPRPDGTGYLAGGTDNEPLPPTAADVKTDKRAIKILKSQMASINPELDLNTKTSTPPTLVAEQACYLPISEGAGTPLLGKLNDSDVFHNSGTEGRGGSIWVASGHSCWGISLGPGSGKVMSELILDGDATSANISRLLP